MKLFQIISTIAFCLLVFISSSSFIIGIHLCRGNVQDVALFTKAESCVNEKKVPPCHRHESKPCCEDETVIHQGQDIKAGITKVELLALPAIDIDQPLVLIAEVIPSAPESHFQYFHYDPPFRSSDLTVSFQVFLI